MMNTDDSSKFDSFKWAVIRLSTYCAPGSSLPRMVFGSVTLLSPDRPCPKSSQGVDRHNIAGGKRGTVYFRRTVLTAQDAIRWYRSSPTALLTPIPSTPGEIEHDLDDTPIAPTTFQDDPEWPSLGMPFAADFLNYPGGPGDPAPFASPKSSRMHRRFGVNTGFDAITADQKAVAFLKRRIHVNIADYSEYLGSLALIVPDPILRAIHHFIVPAEADTPERLVYRLVARPGESLAGLSLTILERRANLLSRFETLAVPEDGLVIRPRPLPVQASGYFITHPVHGILAASPPTPFLRTVHVSVGVMGRRVRVDAPQSDSPRSKSAAYEVNEFEHEIPVAAGDREPIPTIGRIVEAESRRERRAEASRYDQTWFDSGTRTEAMAFLRARIAGARSKVLVADPYFGARQILQFLHAVPRTQIDFFLLTSRLAFENDPCESDSLSTTPPSSAADGPSGESAKLKKSLETRRIEEFRNAMETLKKRGMRSACASVLRGKNPPLHDRFLVVDDKVWFLGNSLNTLGERASLILQVPDPEPVIQRLDRMNSQARPFEDYAAERLKHRIPKPGANTKR